MTDPATTLRHDLHRHPELSGREVGTAKRIVEFFRPLGADQTIEHLGGNGLAFVFSGALPGPTVLLRCELDALPIQETGGATHRSLTPAVAHQCGHDGHMAILAAVGVALAQDRPARGRVVLLYQPAEEIGQGAAAVLGDSRFEAIRPDFVFALHNLPGYPLGQVVVRAGAFNCASRGAVIRLTGATAHAAQPETGISPALAMCRLIEQLSCLPPGIGAADEIAFATVVGSRLGDKTFGTAPGNAEIWVTLRAETDATMDRLTGFLDTCVADNASAAKLGWAVSYEDVFQATINAPAAVDRVRLAAPPGALRTVTTPFRWSEDFGLFTSVASGALFGIGAGENTPDLHDARYDFPDALIPVAAKIFGKIIADVLL